MVSSEADPSRLQRAQASPSLQLTLKLTVTRTVTPTLSPTPTPTPTLTPAPTPTPTPNRNPSPNQANAGPDLPISFVPAISATPLFLPAHSLHGGIAAATSSERTPAKAGEAMVRVPTPDPSPNPNPDPNPKPNPNRNRSPNSHGN